MKKQKAIAAAMSSVLDTQKALTERFEAFEERGARIREDQEVHIETLVAEVETLTAALTAAVVKQQKSQSSAFIYERKCRNELVEDLRKSQSIAIDHERKCRNGSAIAFANLTMRVATLERDWTVVARTKKVRPPTKGTAASTTEKDSKP